MQKGWSLFLTLAVNRHHAESNISTISNKHNNKHNKHKRNNKHNKQQA